MHVNKFYLLSLAVLVMIAVGCRKEDDIISPVPEQVRLINRFVKENMEIYYFWNDLIPKGLNPETEIDTKAFFNKMLNKPEDRWSIITEDAEALANSLRGIEKTFGHQFRLFRLGGTPRVFGIVTYVLPDSPADRAGIVRGDLFDRIDGIELNIDNYPGLLFSRDQYAISFSELAEGQLLNSGRSLMLEAETIQENPVFYKSVIDKGAHKIAYLVYNQFIPDFNNELIDAFREFKAAGVNDLVLDLRYNPGGSISTSLVLASLTAPRNAAEAQSVFVRYLWNELIRDYFIDQEGEDSPQLVSKLEPQEYNLDLDRIFILVTRSTASASELIINGLSAYMEVILIGQENTSGKYTGSITISDPQKRHSWAIQPIVLKTANALGIADFADGFSPGYAIQDDYFSPLGSLDEDMLAKAYELITGTTPALTARRPSVQLPPGSIYLDAGGRRPIERRQIMILD